MSLLKRNLDRCGEPIVIRVHAEEAADTSQRHRGRDESNDLLVATDGTTREYRRFEIDGDLIKSSDLQLVVNADGLPDLRQADSVIFNGNGNNNIWKIMRIKVYQTRDEILLYKFQIRR